MQQIINDKNVDVLYKKAADIIKKSIDEILESKEYVLLAIPGGRSVPGIFNILKEEDINWKKVHIFIVDERLVPLEDKDSNGKLAKDTFVDELISSGKLPQENFHPFNLDIESDDKGILAYEDELKKYGGSFDIILLSSGEDGHVGGLYPNHHSIEDDSEFFIIMDDSPKPPPKRMSSSRKLLLRSNVAVIMFLGEGKKDALVKFLDGNLKIEDVPAKIINSINSSFVLTDIKYKI